MPPLNSSTAIIGLIALVIVIAAVIPAGVTMLYLQRRGESKRVLQTRLDELKAVSNAVRALASAKLDEDELCKLTYEQVKHVVDADTFQLGVFEGDYYIPKLRFSRGMAIPLEKFDLTDDGGTNGGIFGWMRQSGRWLNVRDFEKEMDTLPAKPRYVSSTPPRSAVFVPMVAVDGMIGAMAVQSDAPEAYTDDHARLLSIIANQAAAAIQNARALARERERAGQLELVSEVAKDTALILDMEALLPRLIEAIEKAFGFYFIGIFLIDDTSQVVCRASTSNVPLVNTRMQSGVGLIGACISQQRIIVSSNVEGDTRYLYEPNLPKTQSEACVPLLVANRAIGVLDLQSTYLTAFNENETGFLDILGQQVAIAIEDARLYEAEREQAWQANALLQVAEISSRADDLDDAVSAVVRIVPKLGSVSMCAVLTTNERASQFVIAALEGQLSEHEELGVGDTLLADDVPALRAMLKTKQPAMGNAAGRLSQNALALPLMAENKLIGAMLTSQHNGEDFSARRIEKLAGIANQAALVMDTVRAKVAEKDETWVTQALLQVAQAVNQTDDLDKLAETVANNIPLLVNVQACAIYRREGECGLRLLRAHGFDESTSQLLAQQNNAWQDWVMVHNAESSLTLNPNSAQPAQPSQLEVLPRGVGAKINAGNCAVLPLITKNKLVGALVVVAKDGVRLPHERTFRILTGIAQQTAVAIESARLQEESFARRKLDQELNFARDIQMSFLPNPDLLPRIPGWSLAGAYQAARQVGGDFYDIIQMPDTDYGLVIADVADKGVPAALFMAMSRTLTRSAAFEGYPPAELLQRVNRLIQDDSPRTDMFVTVFFAKWNTKTGNVAFCNAGHNPPLVFRANTKGNPIQMLPMRGIALGVLPNAMLRDESVQLEQGDVLLLYTDGITDALNKDEEEFGLARLESVLRVTASLSAREIATAIMSAVAYFAGDESPFDDQTLVVLKREQT